MRTKLHERKLIEEIIMIVVNILRKRCRDITESREWLNNAKYNEIGKDSQDRHKMVAEYKPIQIHSIFIVCIIIINICTP
jgi:hypothetical protein